MAFRVQDDIFYVHLSSDGCQNMFPSNTATSFSIRLQNPKILHNSERNWTVGVSDFYYDSRIRNMGKFCDTYMWVLRGTEYIRIDLPDECVQDFEEAMVVLNNTLLEYDLKFPIPEKARQAIETAKVRAEGKKKAKFETEESLSEFMKKVQKSKTTSEEDKEESDDEFLDGVHNIRNLSSSIGIKIDPSDVKREIVTFHVHHVHDFGMSFMLRKLLGVLEKDHRVYSENFEKRRKYREFISEYSGLNAEAFLSFCNNIRKSLFDPSDWLWKGKKDFWFRNEILERFGLNIERFDSSFRRRGLGSFDSGLTKLIQGDESSFEQFLSERYTYDEMVTVFDDIPNRPIEKYHIFEYVLWNVVSESVNSALTFRSEMKFSPQIFDQIFIYANIIKEESFNDFSVRLLDIIPIQKAIVQDRKRTEMVHFVSARRKIVNVDILDEIQISIRSIIGTPIPFMAGPVLLTLEFRR